MKWVRRILLLLVLVLLVGQLYRPSRTNPPVNPAKSLYAVRTVPPNVHEVLDRSCNDCHSNRTVWPWYSNFFPINWFLTSHVRDGRKQLNVDAWADLTPRREAHKLLSICEEVQHGDMPLKTYLPLHPTAKLSAADKQVLCEWSGQLHDAVVSQHPEAAAKTPANPPAK
jgi:hypothetical protein